MEKTTGPRLGERETDEDKSSNGHDGADGLIYISIVMDDVPYLKLTQCQFDP